MDEILQLIDENITKIGCDRDEGKYAEMSFEQNRRIGGNGKLIGCDSRCRRLEVFEAGSETLNDVEYHLVG